MILAHNDRFSISRVLNIEAMLVEEWVRDIGGNSKSILICPEVERWNRRERERGREVSWHPIIFLDKDRGAWKDPWRDINSWNFATSIPRGFVRHFILSYVHSGNSDSLLPQNYEFFCSLERNPMLCEQWVASYLCTRTVRTVWSRNMLLVWVRVRSLEAPLKIT